MIERAVHVIMHAFVKTACGHEIGDPEHEHISILVFLSKMPAKKGSPWLLTSLGFLQVPINCILKSPLTCRFS